MIPRKWEWIKEQCIKHGFKKAAELAGEIEYALLECYDREHTREWTEFCENNNMNVLVSRSEFYEIVTDPVFCVACEERKAHCGDGHSRCVGCCFAAMCGDCGDQDSLFKRFLREMGKVWICRPNAMIFGEEE